jgi:hypothetical protein
MASTSAATSATRRPASRSDSPYPGRSKAISWTPSRCSTAERGCGPNLLPGVPCRRITGLPSGSPYIWVESRLPSVVRTVCFKIVPCRFRRWLPYGGHVVSSMPLCARQRKTPKPPRPSHPDTVVIMSGTYDPGWNRPEPGFLRLRPGWAHLSILSLWSSGNPAAPDATGS